jgi:hypothetical protein
VFVLFGADGTHWMVGETQIIEDIKSFTHRALVVLTFLLKARFQAR